MALLALALGPSASLAAAKLTLLLASVCAVGRVIAAVADALLGGTDDLP